MAAKRKNTRSKGRLSRTKTRVDPKIARVVQKAVRSGEKLRSTIEQRIEKRLHAPPRKRRSRR